MKPKLIVILGPTASGKSALAVKLAKEFSGEIINADSRQIYAGMRVGTASPIPIPRHIDISTYRVDGIPQHLFHFVKPDEYFSVADYKKLALEKIYDIQRRKKIPFLVGGTGLYIWAVVDNLAIPRVPPQQELRKMLESSSVDELLRELKKKDSEAAALTGPNKRRIIRALEVMEVTGKKFSEQRKIGAPLFDTLQIGLTAPFTELDQHIEIRAHEMLKRGLVAEVKTLLEKYPPNLPAFDALGYRHFIRYFQGELSLAEAIEQFIKSHKQLARRQLRWFKRDPRISWFTHTAHAKIKTAIQNFLTPVR